MLHILMSSPFKRDIDFFFSMINYTDCVIAIQDGVIIAYDNNVFLKKILKKTKNLYVLEEDLLSRGIKNFIYPLFKIVNYSNFVNLTIKCKKIINW